MSNFYEIIERAFERENAGLPLIRLNVGETSLPTPPEAIRAAEADFAAGKVGYGPAAGISEFRARIADREGVAPDEIIVGPGSKHLIYGLLSVLLKPGDTLLAPTPTWPAYFLMADQLGLKCNALKTAAADGWVFDLDAIQQANAVLICNPMNPTSTLYPDAFVTDVIERAQELGVPIIVDEAYRGLALRELPAFPGAIRVRTFSKEFRMEGWRLGYVVASPALIKRLTSFQQITTTCVPRFVQRAGMAVLEVEERIESENLKYCRTGIEQTCPYLESVGFTVVRPESGFYVFAQHPEIRDSSKLALDLIDQGVAISPGTAFGDYPDYIRLSLNRPPEALKEGLEIIANFLKC